MSCPTVDNFNNEFSGVIVVGLIITRRCSDSLLQQMDQDCSTATWKGCVSSNNKVTLDFQLRIPWFSLLWWRILSGRAWTSSVKPVVLRCQFTSCSFCALVHSLCSCSAGAAGKVASPSCCGFCCCSSLTINSKVLSRAACCCLEEL